MVCFQTKNPKFGLILEGLVMVIVGIFYDHLDYFMAIWYNLWPFGMVCGHLFYFSPFWNVGTKKNLATLLGIIRHERSVGPV
jgi:hypothetical protein